MTALTPTRFSRAAIKWTSKMRETRSLVSKAGHYRFIMPPAYNFDACTCTAYAHTCVCTISYNYTCNSSPCVCTPDLFNQNCYIPLSDDFRQSACISFVQHFVEKYASKYTGNAAHAASKQQPVENGLTSSNHNNSSSDVTQVTRDATAAKAVLRYRVENYPKSH